MLISCRWLNDLLAGEPIVVGPTGGDTALPEGKIGAEALADRLTNLGLEVEGLAHFDLPGVIVGEVRKVDEHPKADKLSLVELFDGSETLQVVCGASNLPEAGGKVAFAPVGTTLPGDFEIGARKVRGVESRGMICSEAELDIGGDGDGILVLPEDWEAGALLRDKIPAIVDSVIDISVTPNRPDALGHIGVAIDLGVALGLATRTPPVWAAPEDLATDDSLVTLEAGDRCGRYFGYALEGVAIGRSPLAMRVRLHRVGLRAINDVVDITNYVLMETGQPLHAFDRAKLREGRVVVRMAGAGEPMTTLDENEIELVDDDLVIADAKAPQALAGVMGGSESMVGSDTSTLLLEIAWFDPKGVRRTARRHDFHTDSSHRFERGVDHGGKLELAAKRALRLLADLCSARCVSVCEAKGELPVPPTILLRPARVSGLLGMDIPAEESARILSGLGVRVDRADETRWACTPPSFRPDLGREVDLIEEVMRHHGLDELPAEHSLSSEHAEPIPEDPRARRDELVAAALRGAGLHEHLGLTFSAEDELAAFPEVPSDRLVRISNPLRAQASVMRSHLLPGLLEVVDLNHARHDRPIGLFELGRIYRWPAATPERGEGPTAEVDQRLAEEPGRAAVIRAEVTPGEARSQSTLSRRVVGELLAAVEAVGLWAEARPADPVPWLHPGVQIGLWIDGRDGQPKQIGVAGELHPDLAKADGSKLDELEIAYGELWLDQLPAMPTPQFEMPARYPSTARDLSLDLDDAVSAATAVEAIHAAAEAVPSEGEDPVMLAAGDTGSAVETLEDYRGKGVEDGRRALLLRLHYRARERTVTDDEVQAVHEAILEAACEALREHDPQLRVR